MSLIQWICLQRWTAARACLIALGLGLGVASPFEGLSVAIASPLPSPLTSAASNPTEPATRVVLGVVLSNSGSLSGEALTRHMNSLNTDHPINYQILDWDTIQHLEDLEGITTLFLPDVKSISPQQLQVLQAWMQEGGRLIASGHLGRVF